MRRREEETERRIDGAKERQGNERRRVGET